MRDQATIDFLGKTFPNPYLGLNPIYGSTMTRGNLLRNYSEFSSVQLNGDPAGYSWYHSLQTRIERRIANGFTLQASYTWSKAMEATEFLNTSDPMPYEVVASLDRTHRLTGSGIWEIPVGRKRHFGANMHPVLNFIAGGWQLSGLYQHQSGAPLGFGNRIFNGDLKNIVLRTNEKSVDHWFTPAATAGFETNSAPSSPPTSAPCRCASAAARSQPGQVGLRHPEGFPRSPKASTTEFRAETFNAFNHPNLYDPNTDPTSASWGVITGQDTPRSWQLSLKIVF